MTTKNMDVEDEEEIDEDFEFDTAGDDSDIDESIIEE